MLYVVLFFALEIKCTHEGLGPSLPETFSDLSTSLWKSLVQGAGNGGEKSHIREMDGKSMLSCGVLLPARCWFQSSEWAQGRSDAEL